MATAQASALPPADLGARVRHARLLHGLTLKAVAQRAQCSESAVSKVERNLAAPSLSMLHRLALALHTNISSLTAEGPPDNGPVLRAGQRPVQAVARRAAHGINLEKLTVNMGGGLLQAHIHIVEPGAGSEGQIEHMGEEIGYVLTGSLLLTLGEERYVLEAGDSFHFASQTPHGYRNVGANTARIVWVNTPPTF
ncbi:MAG: XRE family transcriptional regulator [Lacisediminimonas sp.]|nr:XRE family transcriptional regulator [Lacisediminimonas sp.]MDO8301007.1 XRE family transcriptional regulator [Lacisediminimonas sp.]